MLINLILDNFRLKHLVQQLPLLTSKYSHERTKGHSNSAIINQGRLSNQITTSISNAYKNISRPDHNSVRNIRIDENVVIKSKLIFLNVRRAQH